MNYIYKIRSKIDKNKTSLIKFFYYQAKKQKILRTPLIKKIGAKTVRSFYGAQAASPQIAKVSSSELGHFSKKNRIKKIYGSTKKSI